MSIDGVRGVQIDVTARSAPEKYSRDHCGLEPCVPLFLHGEADETRLMVSYPDYRDRFIVMDIEDQTVIINVAAPTGTFGEFAPGAQKVLDTVEWGDR